MIVYTNPKEFLRKIHMKPVMRFYTLFDSKSPFKQLQKYPHYKYRIFIWSYILIKHTFDLSLRI